MHIILNWGFAVFILLPGIAFAADCGDDNNNCPSWASRGECKKNPKYMLLKCKKSCKICPSDCKDASANCGKWAINGDCYKNPSYMMYKCQKSCKLCGQITPNCPDASARCGEWLRQGECLKNPKYMLLNCKDSCQMCKKECTNANKKCDYWSILEGCYKNAKYMMYSCQKACNVCGGNDPNCPDKSKKCGEWARQGQCLKNPKYMLLNCQDSCHMCKKECKDESKKCVQWAISGECYKNPNYMMYKCQRACRVCGKPDNDCSDQNANCAEWLRAGECKKNPSYMSAKCQSSCYTCPAAAADTPVTKEPTSAETGECVDDDKDCAFRAQAGECLENHRLMLQNCKKSCKVCKAGEIAAEKTGECKDDAPQQCAYWAKIGECKEDPMTMNAKCPRACKICSGGKDVEVGCADLHESCKEWASQGQCAKNPKYMLATCQISCGICAEKEVPKNEPTKLCSDSFKADFTFLVDASGSVKAPNFEKMKKFIQDVVAEFPIGPNKVQVALVRFSSKRNTKRIFYLNKYKTLEDVQSHIASVEYVKGPTYTAYALNYIRRKVLRRSKGARKNVPKLVVILTDGTSTDRKNLPKALHRIHRKGARLFVVGIGKELNETELNYMASNPKGEHLLHASDFSKLHGILQKLKETTCRVRPTCEEGYDLKVDRCVKCTTFQVADIVFVMDASMSIGTANFDKIKKFCDDVIKKLRIGEDQVRIAAVRYSNKDTTKVFLFLNSQFSKDGVLAGIQSIDYKGGMTFSGYALKMVKNQVLKINKGMRQWTKNLVVLITDGYASDNMMGISAELQGEGAMVMAVAIGNGADVNGLKSMVSAPGDENVIAVSDFGKLDSVVKELEEKDCTETRACPVNWMYKEDLCLECKMNFRADIVFVLDSSSSVKGKNFKKMLDCVRNVISNMPIGATKVRVALVRYSAKDDVRVAFYLNEHFTAGGLQSAIDNVLYTGGSTYTAKALELVRSSVLTRKKGSRKWVKHLVVVITDGNATDQTKLPNAVLNLQDTGAKIIAVGVGNDMDEKSLKSMASHPKSQNTLQVSNFDQLVTIVEKVKESACQ